MESQLVRAGATPPPAVRLVEVFLAGRNPRTLRAYEQDLEDFRAYTETDALDTAARLLLAQGHGAANAIALGYKAAMLDRGLSAASINRRLAALRSLVKLARMLGLVPWTLEVQNMKSVPYRDTRGPGRQGFSKMLAALEARGDRKAIRDRAIIRLLYDLGLRRAEVCSLDIEDVDLGADTIEVLGKGHTEKIRLTLPPETKDALGAWISASGNTNGPVFTNFGGCGRRITGKGLYLVIRKLGEVVGIEVRPHGLRHAAITEALDVTGGDVRRVQKFSRHRDVRTLTTYDDNRTDMAGEVAKMVAANGK